MVLPSTILQIGSNDLLIMVSLTLTFNPPIVLGAAVPSNPISVSLHPSLSLILAHYRCLVLARDEFAAAVKGRRVLELGCGLGLPGIVASRWLGAEHVLLTDRAVVAELCDRNIAKLQLDGIEARTLEWQDPQDLENCGEIDVILAADCIFQPLYGDSFPLWDVLQRFCVIATAQGRPLPAVFLSAERRPDDGIDEFLQNARDKGTVVDVLWRHDDPAGGQSVSIYQLHLALAS